MCAIAGFIGMSGIADLRRMADAMAHRGPDGDGYFHDPQARVGLAHRRLAIIDPTDAGAQPMSGCGGRYQVVFNGEIYNFRELAADLVSRGYSINTNSDTAILAPLYDLLGPSFLSKLNGIFALAIWDVRKRELFISRDAQGVKPLYFTRIGGGLAFASELKALTRFLDDPRLNERAVLDYLVNLWSAGAATPFRDVSKLPPGHQIVVRAGRIEVGRWYQPPRPVQYAPLGTAALVDSVSATFDRAVARQCVSDVPIGAFLSGGVDSSAIVAAMVATGHTPKRTYCIAFNGATMEGEGFGDDRKFAAVMANQLGVPLTIIDIAEPTPEDIADLPFLLDEPTADPAALYVAAIAKAARADGIKVLLGGTGGDDVFTGYRRHRAAALRQRLGGFGWILRAVQGTGAGRGPFLRRISKLAYMMDGSDLEFLLRAFEFNRAADAMGCLTPDFAKAAVGGGPGWLEQAAGETQGRPLVDRMLDLELQGFLPDHNLNYTDKAAMAHGVEVRVPFLDSEVIAHAATIPWHLKMHGTAEKWIFKKAMSDRLPAAILNREKTGFGAPLRSWITRPPLNTLIQDTISSRSFAERGVFAPSQVRRLLEDTVRGQRDGAYLLLAVVVVEHWMRHFMATDRLGVASVSTSGLGLEP